MRFNEYLTSMHNQSGPRGLLLIAILLRTFAHAFLTSTPEGSVCNGISCVGLTDHFTSHDHIFYKQ